MMMSVLEQCIIYGNDDQPAGKAFFGLLGELFLQTFCLKDIPRMQNILLCIIVWLITISNSQ